MCLVSPVVASGRSERGDIVLLRRERDDALELRVNGVFVMDDVETSSERRLAALTLACLDEVEAVEERASPAPPGGWRVVVGGLGLGFTLAEVVAHPRVDSVLVVEIEPDLVAWHRSGLVPGGQVDDERVEVAIGDVRDVVARLPDASVDLIVLDVDNGPDFLVYDANAAVYESPFLTTCRAALTPNGRLAVWSADSSPALTATLDAVFGSSTELVHPVTLQSRATTYHVFLAPR